MKKHHKCQACGIEFPIPTPPGPLSILTRRAEACPFFRDLRDSETIPCPKCGHIDSALQYRFFGVFTARALRWLILLVLLACLAWLIVVR